MFLLVFPVTVNIPVNNKGLSFPEMGIDEGVTGRMKSFERTCFYYDFYKGRQ